MSRSMNLNDILNLQELEGQKEQIKAYIMKSKDWSPLPKYLRDQMRESEESLLNSALEIIDREIARLKNDYRNN